MIVDVVWFVWFDVDEEEEELWSIALTVCFPRCFLCGVGPFSTWLIIKGITSLFIDIKTR
jgi:hypothetical protein